MRHMKIVLAVGVALALCATAMADALPLGGYTGPVYMHINDYSMGAIYDPTGQPEDEWLPVASVDILVPTTGGVNNESGWSIVEVDQVFSADLLEGTNTMVPLDELWNASSNNRGKEVYGLLYGKQDLFVKFNSDGTQDFLFESDIIDIYVQDTGTYAAETREFLGLAADGSEDPASGIFGAAGSSGRFALDKYVGIGFDDAGAPIADLALRLESEEGYYPVPELNPITLLPTEFADPKYNDVEGRAHFAFDAVTGTGSGDVDAFYSVIGGDQADWWDGPEVAIGNSEYGIFTPQRFLTAEFDGADFRVHATNSPVARTALFDWLTQSSDPVTAHLIPEPMTMLGVLTGIGGLAGYVRKRRRD